MRTAFLSFLCLAFCFTPFAQPGSLDSSFRTNGLGIDDFGYNETIVSSAVQPDGKIIFVGSDVVTNAGGRQSNNCAISRYTADGFPDSSFGKNGLISLRVNGNGKADWGAVALQPDGKIVISGALYTKYPDTFHFVVFRCLPDGTIDSTFGDNGFVQPDGGTTANTYLFDIKVQPDGKIIAAGKTEQSGTGTSMLVVRLATDGKRDPSFGINGKKVVSIGTYSLANALQVLPGGNILLGGDARIDNISLFQFTAVRLTASGLVDSSFGKNGSIITPIYDYSHVTDIVLTGAGRFVMGGVAVRGDKGDFALAGYHANGTLDSSFGKSGIVTTNFGIYDNITQLALQPDGKIVAFGITEKAHGPDAGYRAKFALARYRRNGKLDAGFGNKGIVTTDFGGNAISQAYTGFIQSNGRIVAAGVTSQSNVTTDFALAGYKSSVLMPALPIAKK